MRRAKKDRTGNLIPSFKVGIKYGAYGIQGSNLRRILPLKYESNLSYVTYLKMPSKESKGIQTTLLCFPCPQNELLFSCLGKTNSF